MEANSRQSVARTTYDQIANFRLILSLAWNDFRTKYAGSVLGLMWAFAGPVVTVVMYWFVFQVALGSGPVNGHPFALWLVAGLVPWMFFQDALNYGVDVLRGYSFLVKKISFNISILPAVRIFSAFFVHASFKKYLQTEVI
jgi:teichoic acid transport system permease protein